jgi:hypothetical protein
MDPVSSALHGTPTGISNDAMEVHPREAETTPARRHRMEYSNDGCEEEISLSGTDHSEEEQGFEAPQTRTGKT